MRPNIDWEGKRIDQRLASLADTLVLDRGGAEMILKDYDSNLKPGDLQPSQLVLAVQECCEREVESGLGHTKIRPWVILKPMGKKLLVSADSRIKHVEKADLVAEPDGTLWVVPPNHAYDANDTGEQGGMDAFIGAMAAGITLDVPHRQAILLGRAMQAVLSGQEFENFTKKGLLESLITMLPKLSKDFKEQELPWQDNDNNERGLPMADRLRDLAQALHMQFKRDSQFDLLEKAQVKQVQVHGTLLSRGLTSLYLTTGTRTAHQ